jgi:hypothetical protein
MSKDAPPGTWHTESDVERRVQIAFSVASEKLQKFLPTKWLSTSLPAGHSEGANFMIAFRNRLQTTHHDADGVDRAGHQDRGAVLLAATRNSETQEAGIWVLRSLAANASGVPGPYRNSKPVTVHMEQRMETRDHQNDVGIERWHLRDRDGEELSMYLRHQIGTPARTMGEVKVRGGPDPNFSRIYRIDRGIDVVCSRPNAVDYIEEFNFRSTLSEFKEIFDGSEQIVSISVEPWYMRQVFLHQKA